MNHRHLSELLDYHYWAQERMFDACEELTPEQFGRDLGNSFKSVRDTLAHIHFAERIWYARWQKEPMPAPPAGDPADLAAIRRASKLHEEKMRAFLDRLGQDGINQVLEYHSRLDDKDHKSIYWQMFQHVINHGTYHRGQITMMLRLLGAKPAGTDLMLFYWSRESA